MKGKAVRETLVTLKRDEFLQQLFSHVRLFCKGLFHMILSVGGEYAAFSKVTMKIPCR